MQFNSVTVHVPSTGCTYTRRVRGSLDAYETVLSIVGDLGYSGRPDKIIEIRYIGDEVSGTLRDWRFELILASSENASSSPGMSANAFLFSVESWIPRRHREFVTGDLLEEIATERSKGRTERQIIRRLIWQISWIVIERIWEQLKPHRWAVFAAVVHYMRIWRRG